MSRLRSSCHISGVLIVLASLIVVVLPAVAATVNGTLTLTPALGQRAERAADQRSGSLKQHYWRVRNGAVKIDAPSVDPARELAVIIERADGQATAPAGATKVVKLQNAQLSPAVIVVTPHTKVRFRNDDAIVYELLCSEHAQMASGHMIAPGREVEFPFDEAGVFEITDRRLPHLVGYVVVVGTALAQNPHPIKGQDQAAFTFPNVPPGQYVVKVFHAGDWIAQQPLEVTETEEVGVQIRLPADGQQHQGAGEANPPREEQ